MEKAILCVDDDAILLIALKMELHSAFGDRFFYITALNAAEAFASIKRLLAKGIKTALVITDLNMPGMNGDELINMLRENDLLIPAIIVTSETDLRKIESLQKSGIVKAIIEKPFDSQALISTINSCLEESL